MNNRFILFVGGGSLAGVFGAGAVTALQKMDCYNQIEAVYGVSVGVFIGAYFLTRQTELGSSIFYEDLTHDFVFPKRIPKGLIQRLWHGYVKPFAPEKILNAVDLNYLFEVVKHRKPLDIPRLKSQGTPLFAKLLNLKTGEVVYQRVDNSNDPLTVIESAVSIAPYYFSYRNTYGHIDAAPKEPIGLKYLVEKYPGQKIVMILNQSLDRKFRHHLKNVLEGIGANPMYDLPFFDYLTNKEKSLRTDLALAKNNSNVLIISPPEGQHSLTFTTNQANLLSTYEAGKKEAEKISEFVN